MSSLYPKSTKKDIKKKILNILNNPKMGTSKAKREEKVAQLFQKISNKLYLCDINKHKEVMDSIETVSSIPSKKSSSKNKISRTSKVKVGGGSCSPGNVQNHQTGGNSCGAHGNVQNHQTGGYSPFYTPANVEEIYGGGKRRRSARRTARRSTRRTARRSARRTARRSARRTARRSTRRTARRSARRTARRSTRRTARQ